MGHFRQCDRDAPYLLPPSVDEWLPKDHLARFVVDIIEQLDLKAVMRFRQFLLRGVEAVRGEWSLVTMAWNIRWMAVLVG